MKKYTLSYLCIIMLFTASAIKAQKVTLDYYFNHEVHKTKDGTMQRFHYLWDDKTNSGFSIWGDAFKAQSATLDTLGQAPTAQNLRSSAIYIIVDPDSKKESASPNYITQQDAENIATWVKRGGVLVMMANDSANVELEHFNTLAAKFGLHFNNDLQNHVINDTRLEDGAINISNNSVFTTAKKVFLKDVCSISFQSSALPVLKSASGDAIAVTLKYGKGTVFAIGDPWLYNEYVNGRLPAGYENDKAAADLSAWLLKQVPAKR